MAPIPQHQHKPTSHTFPENVGKCSINYDGCLAGTTGPGRTFSGGIGERVSPEAKRCSHCQSIPEEWFWALDMRETIIPLCVQGLETLKMLVMGRFLSYTNINNIWKLFLCVNFLSSPSAILAIP